MKNPKTKPGRLPKYRYPMGVPVLTTSATIPEAFGIGSEDLDAILYGVHLESTLSGSEPHEVFIRHLQDGTITLPEVLALSCTFLNILVDDLSKMVEKDHPNEKSS